MLKFEKGNLLVVFVIFVIIAILISFSKFMADLDLLFFLVFACALYLIIKFIEDVAIWGAIKKIWESIWCKHSIIYLIFVVSLSVYLEIPLLIVLKLFLLLSSGIYLLKLTCKENRSRLYRLKNDFSARDTEWRYHKFQTLAVLLISVGLSIILSLFISSEPDYLFFLSSGSKLSFLLTGMLVLALGVHINNSVAGFRAKLLAKYYKGQTVCVSASMKFKKEVIDITKKLDKLDIKYFTPAIDLSGKSKMSKPMSRLFEEHFEKIDKSDSLFVVNPGGYFGDSVKVEIGYAKGKGKKIYFLEKTNNPDLDCLADDFVSVGELYNLKS